MDRGEAKTAAQLSRGASFVSGTWRSVRRSRLSGRSQVSVQEQTARDPTHRVDATARKYPFATLLPAGVEGSEVTVNNTAVQRVPRGRYTVIRFHLYSINDRRFVCVLACSWR